jgi:hypothetical protein
MSSRVRYLRFGPRCADTAGFDLVSTRRLTDLEPLAPDGALIVEGHLLTSLTHLVEAERAGLPPGHKLVGILPCASTGWFWDEAPWQRLEDVVEGVSRVVEGCVDRDPTTLVRALLGEAPTAPSRIAHTVAAAPPAGG